MSSASPAHSPGGSDERVDLSNEVLSVLASCPDATVAAGLTAARIHGLWLPPASSDLVELIVHPRVPVPADRPHLRRRGIRSRRQMLRDDEVTVVNNICVTTEVRTWIDLAETLRTPDLVAAGDSVLRGAGTVAEMREAVRRAWHKRGVVRARMALPLLDARSRSRPESHLRYILVTGGLPKPAVNVPIFSSAGEWLGEPDLSYDDVRLALEYNGADHASVERMQRDITRTLDIDDRGGWRTVALGPAQVFRSPEHTVAVVRRLRYERSQR